MISRKNWLLLGLSLFLWNCVEVNAADDATTEVAPDSPGMFDATSFENRVNKSQKFSCGERSDKILDELKVDLASMPTDATGVGAAFDVCGASFESNTFFAGDEPDTLKSSFMIGTNVAIDMYYWLFIFLNDEDITREIMGERNLILVREGDVSSVPIIVDSPGRTTTKLLSVLALDARIATSDHYRLNSLFVSAEIRSDKKHARRGISSINYIDGVAGFYNPYPAGLSYSQPETTETGKSELIFSIDADEKYQELSTTFIDFINGRRIDSDCGVPNHGLLNIRYFDTRTIRIVCDLKGHDLKRSVLAVLTPDYFVDSAESKNSGAYGASFSRFYKTH